MAVQQNKPTRSKRGMRRSHDALTAVTSLSVRIARHGDKKSWCSQSASFCGRD